MEMDTKSDDWIEIINVNVWKLLGLTLRHPKCRENELSANQKLSPINNNKLNTHFFLVQNINFSDG